MTKIQCETVPVLSIYALNKSGGLKNGQIVQQIWSGLFGEIKATLHIKLYGVSGSAELSYEEDRGYQHYSITVTTTRPFYGGLRYWWKCPLAINGIPCEKRVGILYLVNGLFGCRSCHDLAYESQQWTHTRGMKWLYDLKRYMSLIQRYEGLRTKFFGSQPTKRHARYARKQQEIDVALATQKDNDLII